MKFLFAFGLLAAASASASTIIDFGAGTNITSAYPGGNGTNAAANGAGIALTSPLVLFGGALNITANGTLECVAGANAARCGDTSSVSNTTAAGLGVGDNRIDGADTITIQVQAGYIVSLISFSLDAFTSGEIATYTINGGSGVNFSSGGTGLQTDTVNLAGTAFSTLTFTANTGNFDLAQLNLNISQVPEPASFALVGLALAGVAFIGRRKRAVTVR